MAYADTILAESSLVSYWRLGDGGSTASDSKGSNNGTYQGSAPAAGDLITAGGDGAHDFNGSSQYVAITGTSSLQPTSITCEAWVNLDSVAANKRIITVADDCFALQLDASGHLQATFWNGSLYRTQTSTATLSTGVTYHVAGTWNDSTKNLTCYINGSQDGQQQQLSQGIVWTTSVFTSAIASGSGGLSANCLDGRVDEAAVYNAALTTELAAHYTAGTTAAGPAPNLYVTRSNLSLR